MRKAGLIYCFERENSWDSKGAKGQLWMTFNNDDVSNDDVIMSAYTAAVPQLAMMTWVSRELL